MIEVHSALFDAETTQRRLILDLFKIDPSVSKTLNCKIRFLPGRTWKKYNSTIAIWDEDDEQVSDFFRFEPKLKMSADVPLPNENSFLTNPTGKIIKKYSRFSGVFAAETGDDVPTFFILESHEQRVD